MTWTVKKRTKVGKGCCTAEIVPDKKGEKMPRAGIQHDAEFICG